jgi:hypothetical protein
MQLRALDGIDATVSGVMLLIDASSAAMRSSPVSAPIRLRMAAGRARCSTRSTPRRRATVPCSAAARSGTFTSDSGELEGMALAGKRSLRLVASLNSAAGNTAK